MSRVIAVEHGFRRAVIAAGLRGAPGAGGGGSAGVSSFNTRMGAVTLIGSDVTDALGYTPVNASSLAEVATSGSYADLADKPAIPSTPAEVGAATAAQGAKADTAVQPGSLSVVATSGAYADLSGAPFIPAAPGDIGAATSAQGALADTAVQPAALTVQLDLKVDKIAGYGLSQENYTAAEKAKLAGLEGSHYRGTYLNLTALQTALPTASAGDYADVDAGTADPVQRYIWDDSDDEWVAQAGSADPITAAQVKTLYESNADTNAYTDAEKSKLGGVAAGATANADTDSLSEGTTNKWFTVARVLDAVLGGLSLVTGSAVVNTDSIQVAIGKLQKQITDLTTVVAGKQATLVSGANIKTVNGSSLLGGGDLVVSGGASLPVVQALTASRNLELADINTFNVNSSSSPYTATIRAQSALAWTADAEIHFLRAGTGNIVITAATGVTLNGVSGGSATMTVQHGAATIKRIGVNAWWIGGLLS